MMLWVELQEHMETVELVQQEHKVDMRFERIHCLAKVCHIYEFVEEQHHNLFHNRKLAVAVVAVVVAAVVALVDRSAWFQRGKVLGQHV
jgi:hypothetical protein